MGRLQHGSGESCSDGAVHPIASSPLGGSLWVDRFVVASPHLIAAQILRTPTGDVPDRLRLQWREASLVLFVWAAALQGNNRVHSSTKLARDLGHIIARAFPARCPSIKHTSIAQRFSAPGFPQRAASEFCQEH